MNILLNIDKAVQTAIILGHDLEPWDTTLEYVRTTCKRCQRPMIVFPRERNSIVGLAFTEHCQPKHLYLQFKDPVGDLRTIQVPDCLRDLPMAGIQAYA